MAKVTSQSIVWNEVARWLCIHAKVLTKQGAGDTLSAQVFCNDSACWGMGAFHA